MEKAVRPTKEARKNAYLYCKFRDEQYALYDEYAKGNGILMKTFLVLNSLFYAKDGLTQKEVAEATHQSKQTVSQIVKNLQHDGYVTLQESEADRRNKTVTMTDAGRRYCGRPVRHISQSEDRAMAMLSPEEQRQLVDLSRRFTENLTRLVRGED
jgi:DNA-binding MarR family transcriptional regulator